MILQGFNVSQSTEQKHFAGDQSSRESREREGKGKKNRDI